MKKSLKCVTTIFGLSLFTAAPVFGQSQALVDAAKREGAKVVVYGSLENEGMSAIKQAFMKKNRHRRGVLESIGDPGDGPSLK